MLRGENIESGKTYNVLCSMYGEWLLCFEAYGEKIYNVYTYKVVANIGLITDIIGDHSGSEITNTTDYSFTINVKKYYGVSLIPVAYNSAITVNLV